MKIVAASAIALLTSACAVTSQPPAPAPVMPIAYAEPLPLAGLRPSLDWWAAFNSPELSALVGTAIADNSDLAMAAERVQQAEALVRVADATLFPALSLGVASGRSGTHVDGGHWQTGNASSATLAVSYELDLWGKNAADVRAAEASFAASRFDRDTVRLTLIAGVASAYFQVLSLRERLAIARKNLQTAERVFSIVDSRVKYGAASSLDLARQQATVLAQRAARLPLELQERQTLFALAVLVGHTPEGFDLATMSGASLNVPSIAPGLPSQLLQRRPDLASAEAQLAAANANVAAARAALLPGIALTGSGGLASPVLINFLKSPTASFALGATLLQSIFDGGRLRAQVDVSTARERELVENYRRAVLAALADVDIALAASGRSAAQERLQMSVVEQAARAFKLAEIRYRSGADDLLVALDAQRTLFQAEDQLAQIRLARLQASVGLFKAIGGAWEADRAP